MRRSGEKLGGNTYLSASTIAHDDEFPSDFSHCWWLEFKSLQLSAASLYRGNLSHGHVLGITPRFTAPGDRGERLRGLLSFVILS